VVGFKEFFEKQQALQWRHYQINRRRYMLPDGTWTDRLHTPPEAAPGTDPSTTAEGEPPSAR
jgi:hypothetical protein